MGQKLVQFAQENGLKDPEQLKFLTRIHDLWDQQIIARTRILDEKGPVDLNQVIVDVVGKNNLHLPPQSATPQSESSSVEAQEPQPAISEENSGKKPSLKDRIGNFFKKLNPFNRVSSESTPRKEGGFSFGKNWWVWIFVVVVGFGVFWLATHPNTLTSVQAFTIKGPKGTNLNVTFLELAFAASIFFSFLEASNRQDPLLMDWWLPYICWGVLIYAGTQANRGFSLGVAVGVFLGMLLVALFWNRAEELQQSWWDRFDTTGLFSLAFALVITYIAKWPALPYPTFVPIALVYVVGAFALFKELIRSSTSFLFGVGVIILGAFAGFYMNWAWVLTTFGLTIAAVYIGAHQEWIPISGARRSDTERSVAGKFYFKLITAWDVMFAWWTSFVLVGLTFHPNFILLIFHS